MHFIFNTVGVFIAHSEDGNTGKNHSLDHKMSWDAVKSTISKQNTIY